MNNREIHFFDLDGTLITVDSKIWIIDIDRPGVPLLRIDKREFSFIVSGLYKKDDLQINYNDQKYFISKELFNKIQKKKIIDISKLGISFVEWYNEEYLNKKKITILLPNILHLVDKDVEIGIITGRFNRKLHTKLLNELRLRLKDAGLSFQKIYFVSDRTRILHDDSISVRKTEILLEHLVGVKIKENKFIPFQQDPYDKVYFYDNEIRNIHYAKDIQNMLNKLLLNTDDKLFKLITERIKNNDLTLFTNYVTGNELNRFDTQKIVLTEPGKFPTRLVKEYNKFISKF
jgi:hypothetical protein